MLAIGVLSGTSMDGIDTAIVRDAATKPRIVAARTYPYARETVGLLMKASSAGPEKIAMLHAAIAEDFAGSINKLIRESRIPRQKIRVIGSHGQTVHHIPGRSSLQLGSPAIIAERTGITVAADFRMDDIAAGGEGAPLVPVLDLLLFAKCARGKRVGILNLGGIANITVLANGAIECAYDIGPANSIVDAAVRRGWSRNFDRDGRIASRGRVKDAELIKALSHPYFGKKPPRTTGPELFGGDFVERFARRIADPRDLVATMTAVSAEATARELNRLKLDEVYVSGGAVHNPVFMDRMGRLARPRILNTSVAGLDPDFKEAVLFAHLGALRLRERAVDLTRVTGAKRPKILGGLWRP